MNTHNDLLTAPEAPLEAPVRRCEHAWTTESRHRTSEGTVCYQRCVRCAARRVDLIATAGGVPAAASRVVGGNERGEARIPDRVHAHY